ncbi:hypothetical protein KIW84_057000 [Lathyrus oleraceus]|uniref:Uncharacterized protein n=1 Tax=Pisum sativum TaxID=3888 RepID=A0A9D4WZU5_PEA|nr:hypothetical protein KIW84_057000 [Pisum sativum]
MDDVPELELDEEEAKVVMADNDVIRITNDRERNIRNYAIFDPNSMNTRIIRPTVDAPSFKFKPMMFQMLQTIGQYSVGVHEVTKTTTFVAQVAQIHKMMKNLMTLEMTKLEPIKYPEEDVVECSMISSWEGIIHKNLLKSNNVLEQELGKLEKEDVQHDGIISGPLCKSYIPEEPVKVLELSTKLKNQRLPSVEVPPELELKQLPFAICLPRGRTKVSSHCGY